MSVNLISIIFLVSALVLMLPAAWMIDNKGMQFSIRVSAFFNFFGCWVRCIAYFVHGPGGFWLVFVGSALVSIANPPLLIGGPKLAANWFGEKERTVATSIAALSNLLGMAASYGMSVGIVKEGKDFAWLYLWQAIIATGCSALGFFLFREKPAQPPSASCDVEKNNFKDSFKKAVRNRPFVVLVFSFGFGYGIFTGLFTVMDQLVGPQGYGEIDAGLFGIIMICSGVAGAGVAGAFLDTTRRYKTAILTLYFGTGIGLALFYSSLFPTVLKFVPQTRGMIMGSATILGFFAIALMPACMEAGVEVTYPMPEATVTAMLMLVGNLSGAMVIVVMTVLQMPPPNPNADGSMEHSMWFCLCLAVCCMIGMLFFSGPYKRYEFEQKSRYEPLIQ
eukprot:TRINITY_DN27303_c0_g1_i1.p1 TRINITY_DN27303_c0_g1~~TRINITY_DN27303_c0_g1_i1.p1  ORF type:complete len:455 (-),score=90.73 TRINITY_DN27303_c0_g1_i1:103-1275(-)